MKLIRHVSNLIYPQRCPVCDNVVRAGEGNICGECIGKFEVITNSICMKCGRKLHSPKGCVCDNCRNSEQKFDSGRILYEYNSVKDSIYRFKYSGRPEYAEFFAEEIATFLGAYIKSIKPDCIIPVPLHKSKEKARGFNQAQLIAEGVGKLCGIPVRDNLVKRCKNTLPLRNMQKAERQNNMKNAFIIGENDVKLMDILIVDDIFTSGSTINELAGTLKEAGAGSVHFVVLASAKI